MIVILVKILLKSEKNIYLSLGVNFHETAPQETICGIRCIDGIVGWGPTASEPLLSTWREEISYHLDSR